MIMPQRDANLDRFAETFYSSFTSAWNRTQLTTMKINGNSRRGNENGWIRFERRPSRGSVRREINATAPASLRGSLLLLPSARARSIFAFSRGISAIVQFWSRRSDFTAAKYATALRALMSGTLTGNFPLESHAECDETRRINERARSAYRFTRYSASLPQIQLRYRAISLVFRRYRCSHATLPRVLTRFNVFLTFLLPKIKIYPLR